jgi:hypothetical protein
MSGHCGVLHAMRQADVALGMAGLGKDSIFRKELTAAKLDASDLYRQASAALEMLDELVGVGDVRAAKLRHALVEFGGAA